MNLHFFLAKTLFGLFLYSNSAGVIKPINEMSILNEKQKYKRRDKHFDLFQG